LGKKHAMTCVSVLLAAMHAGASHSALGWRATRVSTPSLRASIICCGEKVCLYNQQADFGAARVSGSLSVAAGSTLALDGANGLVLYQRNEFSYVFVTPDPIPSAPGASIFAVPPTDLVAGLVLNWKGERVGGAAAHATSAPNRAAYGSLLQQKERVSPRASLLTGITAIDVLAPLGRGQSMLVIGPEDPSTSDLCIDLLVAQKGTDVATVYVAMRPEDEMVRIAERAGCVAVSSSTEGSFIASVGAAMALAEKARDDGRHCCVVVDDLQPLRSLWKFMQHTERKMYTEKGIDDFPAIAESAVRDDASGSELRTFYAAILERAGVRAAAAGGGSITLLVVARKPSMYVDAPDSAAFPLEAFDSAVYPKATLERLRLLSQGGVKLTAAVLAKLAISSPGSHASGGMLDARKHIDECISLADGHLVLDERLVRASAKPPIDVRESLSRIGLGKAVNLRSTPMAAAIRQLAPRLRLELAVASDVPTGATMTDADRRTFAWRAVLQQQSGEPRSLAQTVFALFCARNGFFDALHSVRSLDEASAQAYAIVGALVQAQPDVAARIRGDYELSAEDERGLRASLATLATVPAAQR